MGGWGYIAIMKQCSPIYFYVILVKSMAMILFYVLREWTPILYRVHVISMLSHIEILNKIRIMYKYVASGACHLMPVRIDIGNHCEKR